MFRASLLHLFVQLAASYIHNGTSWNYDHEGSWPGKLCQEGGRRQSPIDIRTPDVRKDFSYQFIKYGTLKFIGYRRVLVSGINNGHRIQFSSEGEESIHPILRGGPLKHRYRLDHMSFHWPSEHSVNGIKYPMEIHFVHVRSDLSVTEALQKKDGLAILAVFSQVQADLEDYQLELTEEVMKYIPMLQESGDRISGVLLDMTKLLSPNKHNYYTYAGSLTSPECNEAAIWIIFDSPIYLSDAQYQLFEKLITGHHNFRSLQKLNRHVIFSPPATHINTPKIVVFFESVASLFGSFVNNVTTFMAKGFKAR